MKENKREVFKYSDIPERHTFTYDGCSVVFYEDTERGEKRTLHSYLGGNLYNSSAFVQTDKEFYCCDRYGNYIPKSYVDEIRTLKQEVKELKSADVFKNILTVFPTER